MPLISYASTAWGHLLKKKINTKLLRKIQRRSLLRVIKGYRTISYEGVFVISGIPPRGLVMLNNLEVRGNYLRNSLDFLDGAIPVSLLPHPSSRKPVAVVTYANKVLLKYKTSRSGY